MLSQARGRFYKGLRAYSRLNLQQRKGLDKGKLSAIDCTFATKDEKLPRPLLGKEFEQNLSSSRHFSYFLKKLDIQPSGYGCKNRIAARGEVLHVATSARWFSSLSKESATQPADYEPRNRWLAVPPANLVHLSIGSV